MFIEAAKLGDIVTFYLQDNLKNPSPYVTQKTFSGTLVGVTKSTHSKSEYPYVLGWLDLVSLNNLDPIGSFTRSTRDWVDNVKDFKYFLGFSTKWAIESSGSIIVKSKDTRIVQPDLSDWKLWAKTGPGQCPCGINKTICTYHK